MYSPDAPYDPTLTRAQFLAAKRQYADTAHYDVTMMGVKMAGHYPPAYIEQCKAAALTTLDTGARYPGLVEQAIDYFACPRLRGAIAQSINKRMYSQTHAVGPVGQRPHPPHASDMDHGGEAGITIDCEVLASVLSQFARPAVRGV